MASKCDLVFRANYSIPPHEGDRMESKEYNSRSEGLVRQYMDEFTDIDIRDIELQPAGSVAGVKITLNRNYIGKESLNILVSNLDRGIGGAIRGTRMKIEGSAYELSCE